MKNNNAHVHFGNLTVNAITNASGVFIGTNVQYGWSSHGKENTGFGSVTGYANKLYRNTSILNDNDIVDSPIDDSDLFV